MGRFVKLVLGTAVLLFLVADNAHALLWDIETVDSVGDVGRYTSIALDASGNPHISYSLSIAYPATYDLKYAYRDASTWHTQTVDGGHYGVGDDTCIALDSSGHPHISYYDHDRPDPWDPVGWDLKYAHWDGSSWQIKRVDRGGQEPYDVGRYTSIALGVGGYPHISYMDWTATAVKYAHYDGSGWQTETVYNGDMSGWTGTSIAIDSSGYPHITFFDNATQDLMYASSNGSSWTVQTVHGGADYVGYGSSLALDDSDYPHISYGDYSNDDLKYAYWDGSGWQIQTPDSIGLVGRWSSLALNSIGNPAISYHDYGNRDLKYASWNGSSWHVETVADLGDVGVFCSLALDGGGWPYISYYDVTNEDLKYAVGSTEPIPEPSTMILAVLSFGFLGASAARRRKKEGTSSPE